MSTLQFLLIGFGIGAVLYIPIGPNGILALRSISTNGYRAAFGTAIGSCMACAMMASMSVWLFSVSPWQINANLLNTLGGLFFILVGVFFLIKPIPKPTSAQQNSLPEATNGSAYSLVATAAVKGFLVGISNPKSLVGFYMLLLVVLGELQQQITGAHLFLVVTGGTLAAAAWWSFLLILIRLTKLEQRQSQLKWVIQCFACILLAVGSFHVVNSAFN